MREWTWECGGEAGTVSFVGDVVRIWSNRWDFINKDFCAEMTRVFSQTGEMPKGDE